MGREVAREKVQTREQRGLQRTEARDTGRLRNRMWCSRLIQRAPCLIHKDPVEGAEVVEAAGVADPEAAGQVAEAANLAAGQGEALAAAGEGQAASSQAETIQTLGTMVRLSASRGRLCRSFLNRSRRTSKS